MTQNNDHTHCPHASEEAEEKKKQLPYTFYENSITTRILTFYVSDSIQDPLKYTDMIHKINTAQTDDTIYIHLNTPGGYMSTGVQIINAMQSTPAHVVTVLAARAFSMGTFIFLAGDEYLLHDDSRMMFHNFSGETGGKGNEMASMVESTVSWFTKLLKKYCSPFLTDDEVNRIIKGEDIWMDADEIRKRLIKIAKKKKPAKKKKSGKKLKQAS